jgi:RecB family exonuclease
MPDALALFSVIAGEALDRLPVADRALERTRLLGSIVGTGVAERVFELEADSGVVIERRWLEAELNGVFTFPALYGLTTRRIEIRGKADRVDLLADGSLAVVDYKLGRLPDVRSSTQIAVYAHCARQQLEAADGRPHPIAAAMYLAFGDDRRLEGRLGSASDPVPLVVETRATEFARAVERIEAGEFPPRPRRPGECQWCGYAGVCRKEYRAEDDEAAEPV